MHGPTNIKFANAQNLSVSDVKTYSLSSLFIQLPIPNSSYRNAVFSGNALTTNTSQNYSHIQLKRAAEATLGGYDVGLNESSPRCTQESIKCDATYRTFDVKELSGSRKRHDPHSSAAGAEFVKQLAES